jgi:hypothetical protein
MPDSRPEWVTSKGFGRVLLTLIPVIWLVVAVFVAVLCRMSARGDAALATRPEPGTPSQSFPGLVLFEDRSEYRPSDERLGRRVSAGASGDRRSRCVVG